MDEPTVGSDKVDIESAGEKITYIKGSLIYSRSFIGRPMTSSFNDQ